MNYKLFIERNKAITYDDWIKAVEAIEGVRINDTNTVGINPKTGEEVSITAKRGDAEVFFSKSNAWHKVYSFGQSISFHSPSKWDKDDNEIRIATFQLAHILNAKIKNEVGDVIDNESVQNNRSKTNTVTESKIKTKIAPNRFMAITNTIRSRFTKIIKKNTKNTLSTENYSKPLSIEVIVDCNSFTSALDVWESLYPFHSSFLDKVFYNKLTGNNIPGTNMADALKRNNDNSFSFRVGEGNIFYNNGGSRFSRAGRIVINNLAANSQEAESFIALLLKDDRFVQARLYDDQYNLLQNATCISAFKNLDLPFDHLPMCSNNLPYPLTQEIIDITQNPGRNVGRIDYVEMIGSTMWLSDRFWPLAGSDKEELISNADFNVSPIGCLTKVVALDKPFTMSAGTEAELQNRLRTLLYKKG
jgi:hypothetical protein